MLIQPAGRRRLWVATGIAATAAVLLALAWWRLDGTAELLAVQAALAGSPRSAEQAYVSIARDHRASRQRPNALLRLAQLQIAKGDPRGALTWLDRLYKEYPASTENGERQYWTVRALLANGDTTRACAVTSSVAAGAAGSFGPDYAATHRNCAAFAERAKADSVRAANGGVPDSTSVQPAGAPAAVTPAAVSRDSQP